MMLPGSRFAGSPPEPNTMVEVSVDAVDDPPLSDVVEVWVAQLARVTVKKATRANKTTCHRFNRFIIFNACPHKLVNEYLSLWVHS